MINAKYYVYIWKIKETNEVFYVGKGCNNRVTSMKNRNKYFKHIRQKYECDYEIVKYFDNEKDAYNYELELGKYYKSIGQAKASYAFGSENKELSKETRQKIRKTLLKNKQKPWNYGLKMSDDYKQKLSKAHKGHKQSENTKKKRSKSLQGHAVSQKTIDALVARRNKSVLVYNDIETLEFESGAKAAKYFNVSPATITHRCQNNKFINGYNWKFKHGNTESTET